MVTVIVHIILIKLIEETSLSKHTSTDEVTHILGTTRDVDIMLSLEGYILHDIINPIRIRETDRVTSILELLDDTLREAATSTIISTHLIMEHGIIIRRSLLHHLGWSQRRERRRYGNLSLTLLTTLGGNEDNTIGTTNTEYGSRRGILQNCDTLDFIRVDIIHVTFYTINLNQRL